jgi:hypothetical protein
LHAHKHDQVTDSSTVSDSASVQVVSGASYEDLMSAAEVFIGMHQQGSSDNTALIVQLLSAALELKPFDLQVLLLHKDKAI